MWTCWKALILTLSDVMINCNCFNDWDYSLLVPNEVFKPYLTLWIACHLSIGNHMTSGNIKWYSFALRFCASNPKSTWQPLLPSAKGLSFTLCFYFMLESRWSSPFPFSFYPLASSSCLKDHHIYIYPIGCKLAWAIIVDITERWIRWEATQ